MKIRMLQTVEDSHKYVITDENGDPQTRFDTRRFEGGDLYDEESGGPDWERRANGLIRLGYAKRAD